MTETTGFQSILFSGSICLLVLVFTLGCGGGNIPARNTYAYAPVANATGYAVAQFKMANNGTLTPLTPATVPDDLFQSEIAIDPTNRCLFTNNQGFAGSPFEIDQFLIGDDGTITPNRVPRIYPGAFVDDIALSPDGRFLIAVTPAESSVSSYSVNASGSLDLVNTEPVGSPGPQFAIVDSTSRFVFVANYGGNVIPLQPTISEYTLSNDGRLALIAVLSTSYPAGRMTVAPNGFLYVNNYGPAIIDGMGVIGQFSIDRSTGGVSLVNTFATVVGGPITFTPNGSYAFVQKANAIGLVAVDARTGALAQNGADVPTLAALTEIAVDPSGHFLVASTSGALQRFSINADGTLTLIGNVLFDNGTETMGIAFAQR